MEREGGREGGREGEGLKSEVLIIVYLQQANGRCRQV